MDREACWHRFSTTVRVLVACATPGLVVGCSPQGQYSRPDAGRPPVDGPIASTDTPVGSGGVPGSGGIGLGGEAGAIGDDAAVGSGGVGAGGDGVGGGDTGGGATGGRGTGGGVAGTGGSAGGSSSGGRAGSGAGGLPGLGGVGLGGMQGGVAGGGQVGTGGMGIGGITGVGGMVETAGSGGMAGTGIGGSMAGGVGGAIGTGGAGPFILSVDFVGGISSSGGPLVPAPAMTAVEIAGFRPASQWSSAVGPSGSLAALRAADGTDTSASLTWSSPPAAGNPGVWRNPYLDVPGDARMMNGYLDPTAVGSPAIVTISGLPALVTSAGYDVYVYAAGDVPSGQTRTYSYAIGAATITVTQSGPPPATFPGFSLVPPTGGTGNTVVFRNLRAVSLTLTASLTAAGQRAPVNGIQIVSPPGP